MNEKDCFGSFNVGFDLGIDRVPLVASPRPPSWPSSPLQFKMKVLLNSYSLRLIFQLLKKFELSYNLNDIRDG